MSAPVPGARATAPVGPTPSFDVRGACASVCAEAGQVSLDDDAIAGLAGRLSGRGRGFSESTSHVKHSWTPPWGPPHLGLADASPARVAGWVLLLSAMNFSFWEDEPRWRVEGHDGYMALAAALRRAHDAGIPVGDPRHDAEMSPYELGDLLAGDPDGPAAPPLVAERHATATSTARWVVEEWGGDALALARSAADAFALAELLATRLPRFRDVAEYRGRRIPLLKRAQIAAFDLGVALGAEAPRLGDRARLTAFADYKLPQLLRAEGVLRLAPALAARVAAREELTSGEEAEVELRAATVTAVDRLAAGVGIDSASLDSALWWLAQGRTDLPPYHRTRTIWY